MEARIKAIKPYKYSIRELKEAIITAENNGFNCLDINENNNFCLNINFFREPTDKEQVFAKIRLAKEELRKLEEEFKSIK